MTINVWKIAIFDLFINHEPQVWEWAKDWGGGSPLASVLIFPSGYLDTLTWIDPYLLFNQLPIIKYNVRVEMETD